MFNAMLYILSAKLRFLSVKNLIYAILALFLIGSVSCGNKDEKSNVTSKKEDMKSGDESSNKLPDDFPSDFPVYIGAKIRQGIQNSVGPSVFLETPDSGNPVSEFYKSEMPKNGYKADSENDKTTNNVNGALFFTKEGKGVTIAYHYDEKKGRTVISIQYSDLNKTTNKIIK